MKRFSFLAFILLTSMFAMSQKPSKVEYGKNKDYAEWLEFTGNKAPAYDGSVYLADPSGKVSANNSHKQLSNETDPMGFQHVRTQQLINNIPVEDGIYISHSKGGKLLYQNGNWYKSNGLTKNSSLSESAALKNALSFVGAKSYKWQDAAEESFIKAESNNPNASFYPKGSLVYYNAAKEDQAANLRLAYKFDIYAADPLSRKHVFVDAVNGAILGSNELIHETNAPGTAITGFSGTQAITTDLNAGVYRLRETGRGNGVQTFNLRKGTSYSRAVDFTDADNTWNNVNTNLDQYATDAHWGAEKTYDFYKNTFNRNSIDGNGFAIKSYVHYSSNYFNAFWDGSRMTYGDGSATDNFKPLTAIDVCGHEITHGLTSFTANLVYSNESGAMNEAFSDIFGTAIEKYARPSQNDWLIGGDFYVIRSMSNPKAYADPNTYKGTYWYTGTADNGGVHTNSGVLNYWFYLLTAGGSGTNDKGFAYNVTGLGIAKSQAIAFRTLTVYLVSSSNYASCRTASIQAATDLYGAGTNEVTQTINAWNAVAVGGGTSPAGLQAPSVLNFGVQSVDQAVIYPNPADHQVRLSFNNDNESSMNLNLIDISGKLLMQQVISAAKGKNNITIDLPSSMQSGTYFMMLNGKKLGQFVKN